MISILNLKSQMMVDNFAAEIWVEFLGGKYKRTLGAIFKPFRLFNCQNYEVKCSCELFKTHMIVIMILFNSIVV